MTDTFDTFKPYVSDENPSSDANRRGPSFPASHDLAVGHGHDVVGAAGGEVQLVQHGDHGGADDRREGADLSIIGAHGLVIRQHGKNGGGYM